MANLQFCDVSSWQGQINWDKYPYKVAVIRVGYGNQGIDAQYKRNWAETKARGIARLPYWFHQPGHDPRKHVDSFLAALGDDPGECAPCWDCESLGNLAPSSLVGLLGESSGDGARMGAYYDMGINYKPSLIDRFAMLTIGLKNQLLDELYKLYQGIQQGLGVFPLIYTNPGFWDSYVTPSDVERDCDLYIANWQVSAPRIPNAWAKRGKTYRIWQRDVLKGQGPAWGMQSQDIDFDEFNGDLQAFNAWAKTSIVPPPPDPTPPPETGIKLRVITDWVYIRSEPRIAVNTVGKLGKGFTVTVQDIFIDRSGVWVQHFGGWSAMYHGGVQYMEHA